MNTKYIIILAVIIFIVTIAVAAYAGSVNTAPPAIQQDVTVTIDGAAQLSNYTVPQPTDWGTVLPGNTYTKNFTVTSNNLQPLTLILYTKEPIGNTQSWSYNNTEILPLTTLQGTLTLTLATSAAQGSYTWQLLAVNGTSPDENPPDNTPVTLQCTIKIAPNPNAISNLSITVGGSKIPLFPEDFDTSFIVNFTKGETLRFQVNPNADYTFVRWDLSNSNPAVDNPLIVSEAQASFTITAKLVPK